MGKVLASSGPLAQRSTPGQLVVLCARAASQGCDIRRPGAHINHGRALGLQGSRRLAFAGPIEANRVRVNDNICPDRRIGPGYASNWSQKDFAAAIVTTSKGRRTSRAPRAPLSQALSFRHSRSSLACLLAPILRLRPQMNPFSQMGSESIPHSLYAWHIWYISRAVTQGGYPLRFSTPLLLGATLGSRMSLVRIQL
jgi:hypothetical protein